MVEIAPSILSADFTQLGEQIAAVERGGAAYIHVDVMDGHFVPNITIGPFIVEWVRKATRLPIDAHLMIENPDNFIACLFECPGNKQKLGSADSCGNTDDNSLLFDFRGKT